MRRVDVVCLGLVVMVFGACAGTPRIEVDHTGPVNPWTSLDAHDGPRDFHFVIVSDRTGGEREGIFETALEKVNLLQPAFVMSVGDLIEGYTEDQAQLDAEWAELDDFVSRLEMPFFYAAGNHDFSNEVMSHDWRRRFGPSYYHFEYKDVLFVVLNSELFSSVANPGHPVPGDDTQEEQLRWVEGVLENHMIEKLYRDQKVYDIFEGTGQIQRLIISRRIFKDAPRSR